MLIEGVFAAVPTPFYSDERVYYRKLEANMAHYSRSLLAGMLLLGSTGEAVMLDDTESREVLRVASEATAPEKVLIAGVGKQSVKGTLELAEAARWYNFRDSKPITMKERPSGIVFTAAACDRHGTSAPTVAERRQGNTRGRSSG